MDREHAKAGRAPASLDLPCPTQQDQDWDNMWVK